MKILVNLITTFRFLYALILPVIKAKVSNLAFIVNIVVLLLSDSLDGILARKYKIQTLYGAIMDTLADKALGIILATILINDINLVIFVIINEILILLINGVALLFKKKTKASILGKIKMWGLSISIVLGYMHYFYSIDLKIVNFSLIITIVLQIVTIINYCVSLIKQKSDYKTFKDAKENKNLKYLLFDTDYYMNNIKGV